MIDKFRIPGSIDKHLPNGRFQSTDTEDIGITGGGPMILAYDGDDYQQKTFATIQEALDALLTTDSFDSGQGAVYVPGRGVNTNNGATGPYEETITIDERGISLYGQGVHSKIEATDAGPVISVEQGDIHIHDLWIDNYGAGPAIQAGTTSAGQTHIGPAINIDRAGGAGIDFNNNAWTDNHVYDFNIKAGDPAAIKSNSGGGADDSRNVYENGRIEQIENGQYIVDGIETGGGDLISNVRIGLEEGKNDANSGTRGVHVFGKATRMVNVSVQEPWRYSTTTGPTIGFEIEKSDVQGFGLWERNCTSAGLRFNSDVTGCRIYGHFPSGIAESTAGYAAENIVNGTGYEEANAETPQSSVWQAGDTVIFRDTGDQSGDDVYTKLHPWVAQSGTWYRHSDGSFV